MQHHIQRDDGRWLVGGGATKTSDKPEAPYKDLAAAMAAIDRYRLVCAVYCPESKNDGFTLFAVRA